MTIGSHSAGFGVACGPTANISDRRSPGRVFGDCAAWLGVPTGVATSRSTSPGWPSSVDRLGEADQPGVSWILERLADAKRRAWVDMLQLDQLLFPKVHDRLVVQLSAFRTTIRLDADLRRRSTAAVTASRVRAASRRLRSRLLAIHGYSSDDRDPSRPDRREAPALSARALCRRRPRWRRRHRPVEGASGRARRRARCARLPGRAARDPPRGLGAASERCRCRARSPGADGVAPDARLPGLRRHRSRLAQRQGRAVLSGGRRDGRRHRGSRRSGPGDRAEVPVDRPSARWKGPRVRSRSSRATCPASG